MNISKSIKNLSLSSAVVTLAMAAAPALAAPLPNGTLLTINPGVMVAENVCAGSCFSLDPNGFPTHAAIVPGTDQGIIIGKDQLSGGQQTGPDSLTNTTPGGATGSFFFFNEHGTFSTTPMTGTNAGVITTNSALNIFDSNSCLGAACNNVTKLGTWSVAWGGMAVPMGSDGGCLSAACSLDQQNGIFVSKWEVTPGAPNSTYLLEYTQRVPAGHPSGFGDRLFKMSLTGTIIRPTRLNVAPTAGNVAVAGTTGAILNWTPVVSDSDNGPSPLTCSIASPPTNGTATVAADCSSGKYVSNAAFTGTDTFTYNTFDGQDNSAVPGTVTATITKPTSACASANPIKSVTVSKSNMKIVGTGNISTFSTNDGNYVFICPTTLFSYNSTSWRYPGKVTCKINDTSAPVTGQAKIGDKLKCTLKPYRDESITIYVRATGEVVPVDD